ncbi:glycoside hydrolase family 1 protein [Spiroplasma endosymbiont of Othius punctulatus]|uniref:glycoside hydrolase family 1 protein n=1 Tax=Spiroplasma endosymbiont of Othius punctulatus TaxID=3066289 RepID=UPI0030D0CB58
MSKFPKDFLWGASTSGYQFEGGWDKDGKGMSVQDVHKDNWMPGVPSFHDGSNHYNNWKEDVALMAEMGFKSYRFSIQWSRIIPDGDGDINQKGLEFYEGLILELKKFKIEPVVTLYHFDLPLALAKDGGWLNRRTIDAFEKYSRTVFNEFKSIVKYWLTINEQNVVVLAGAMLGMGSTGKSKNPAKDMWQVNHNLLTAQARAIIACREICPDTSKIGPAPNIGSTYQNSNKPEDYYARLRFDLIRNWTYLDVPVFGTYNKLFLKDLEKTNAMFEYTPEDMKQLANSKPDFIAFNYYQTTTIENPIEGKDYGKMHRDQHSGFSTKFFAQVKNENLPKTEFGWEIDPIGFKNTLREVFDRYQLPLMITENGIGANDKLTSDNKVHDEYRIKYYQQHIEQMSLAIDDGVEMIGYMPWSAIDLLSTHEGITKRYGFIYVNRDEFDLKDMARYKKDSFFWYQKMIKSNGEKLD